MKTYKINTEATNGFINTLLKDMRKEGFKDAALNIRKVYSNLKNKEFSELPTEASKLEAMYNGSKVSPIGVKAACNRMLNELVFESNETLVDTQEYDIPEISICEEVGRYEFMNEKAYDEMTAEELSLVLFKDLGAETETQIQSMQAGNKSKLNLLDDLKVTLLEKYPNIRVELLEKKLANALAVTKLKHNGSLDLIDGRLAVYDYLTTDLVVDSSNFLFMAKLDDKKQDTLDIMILKSAFKTYKELVAQGKLPPTENEFNLSVAKVIQGVKPVSEATKALLDNIKF